MKTLRKSSENGATNSYYAGICNCGCMTYCDPNNASWYPREANANESVGTQAYNDKL